LEHSVGLLLARFTVELTSSLNIGINLVTACLAE
jgi:hypothetical protein